jgi:hypothetical protein
MFRFLSTLILLFFSFQQIPASACAFSCSHHSSSEKTESYQAGPNGELLDEDGFEVIVVEQSKSSDCHKTENSNNENSSKSCECDHEIKSSDPINTTGIQKFKNREIQDLSINLLISDVNLDQVDSSLPLKPLIFIKGFKHKNLRLHLFQGRLLI